jgi:hypothetical protein
MNNMNQNMMNMNNMNNNMNNNMMNMNNNMMNMNNNMNNNMMNMNNNMNNNMVKMNNMNNNMMNMNNNMMNMNNMNNNYMNTNNNFGHNNNDFNKINIMNNNNLNKQIESKGIELYFRYSNDWQNKDKISIQALLDEKISTIIDRFRCKTQDSDISLKFKYNAKELNPSLTLAESKIEDGSVIYVVRRKSIKGAGGWFLINIKFIKISKGFINKNYNQELFGVLKLCLLKEISQKIPYDKLRQLPNLSRYIIELMKRGCIAEDPENIRKNIKEVLEKMEGSNIINFANFVDEVMDSNEINIILNLLKKDDLKEINDIKSRLSQYIQCIKLFNKEFEKSKKESIFEFSVISLIVIEREDFETFERERNKCPNRIDKILYHGTSVEPISSILTGLYRKSLENYKAINGKGVYFTDLLDYGWYYGGKGGNRENFSGIPKIDDSFTVIINSIYYDRNGFKQVHNGNRTPGKNQINFAYAGARSERLNIPDKSKFLASEYVIYDLDQICPFMSATLKRVEYCVIWRDDNFSSKPIWNNEFDEKFKKFLKERLKFINQNGKYNIYPCETTEEALKLVNRKKYNKIILISNVGKNLGGKHFVEEARKIIGNDVIALFLAYSISHLDWIKNFKNAIFSNDPKFYEDYLQCFGFDEESDKKVRIEELIKKMENHYKVKFKFYDNYLYYPRFKNDGKYEELRF